MCIHRNMTAAIALDVDSLEISSFGISRKRIARDNLSDIDHDFDQESSSSFIVPENNDQFTAQSDSQNAKKRQHLESKDIVKSFKVSDLNENQSISPNGCVNCTYKNSDYCSTAFGATVCGYNLIGTGDVLTAFSRNEKIMKICRIIDADQYKKLLLVRERLFIAKKFWKYDDAEELGEFILPRGTEVCVGENNKLFLMSPWHYGTLYDRLKPGFNRLSESEAFIFYKQILRAVAFCHTCGIIMCDFKLRKFAFTDKEMGRLRLHDVFDLHICKTPENDRMINRRCCPPYVAPELIRLSIEYAGRPSDIWSFGVLLYVLVFNSYPFNGATPKELLLQVAKAQFDMPRSVRVSFAARTLIAGILKKEPSQRPTAEQLLHVPWLNEDEIKFAKASFFARTLRHGFSAIAPTFRHSALNSLEVRHLFTRMKDRKDGEEHEVPLSDSSFNEHRQSLIRNYIHSVFPMAVYANEVPVFRSNN